MSRTEVKYIVGLGLELVNVIILKVLEVKHISDLESVMTHNSVCKAKICYASAVSFILCFIGLFSALFPTLKLLLSMTVKCEALIKYGTTHGQFNQAITFRTESDHF